MEKRSSAQVKHGTSKPLTQQDKMSLRKFSVSMVVLKAVPVFIIAVFVTMWALKTGTFTLDTALLAILFALLLFYFLMPKMTQKVYEGIIAVRETGMLRKEK